MRVATVCAVLLIIASLPTGSVDAVSGQLEMTRSHSTGARDLFRAETDTPLRDLGHALEIPMPDPEILARFDSVSFNSLAQIVYDFDGRLSTKVYGVPATGGRTLLAKDKTKSEFFGLAFSSHEFTTEQLAGYDHLQVVFHYASDTILGAGLHVSYGAGITGVVGPDVRHGGRARTAWRRDTTHVNTSNTIAGRADLTAAGEVAAGEQTLETRTHIQEISDSLGAEPTVRVIGQAGARLFPEQDTTVRIRLRAWHVPASGEGRTLLLQASGKIGGQFESVLDAIELNADDLAPGDEIFTRTTFSWKEPLADGSELFAATGAHYETELE